MQTDLSFGEGSPSHVEALLARGDLRIEVDPPRFWGGSAFAAFAGLDMSKEHHGSLVHVVSIHRGGEIRGYLLVGGRLHLRLPNYAGQWDELDDAVAKHLGATVHPYRLGAGGMELT